MAAAVFAPIARLIGNVALPPPFACFTIVLAVVLLFAGLWKTFEKAGQPGWAALIPFYNGWVLVQVARRSVIYFILLLVPLINVVVFVMIAIDIARQFGKGLAFGLGLGLLSWLFFPMLGFGDAVYQPRRPA